MKLNTERFSGIFQVPQIYPICVIGAGGIGADLILTAGKMGFGEILIYDDDAVDWVNIATQFHAHSDVGKPKVDAIGDRLWDYAASVAVTHNERVGPDTDFPFPVNVVISAVDSIEARKGIWGAVMRNAGMGNGPRWYIDCRMAAMEFQMWVIDLGNADVVEDYDAMMMGTDESDIEELPCTEKATTFLAKIASGLAGAELMHIVKNEAISRFVVMNVNTLFLHQRKL